jgi:presenilin-like A22 family membrane protease
MKHTWTRTLALLLLFLGAQLIGLIALTRYIDIDTTALTGVTVVHEEKYLFLPPQIPEGYSWLYILGAVGIGTGLALLIIRFRRLRLWKLWFFLSVLLTLSLGFFPFIEWLALAWGVLPDAGAVMIASVAAAFVFAIWKLFFPNPIVYNFTELFVYSGVAALLVPILNLLSVVLLLLAISAYDVWAVFKTKHMVSMATFQAEAKTFAGLMIPPMRKKGSKPGVKLSMKGGSQAAILGGGDIAFPMLFSGVVLKLTASFFSAFLISIFAAAGLLTLFMIAKKHRFYPAMPFVTAGCLIGLAIVQFL